MFLQPLTTESFTVSGDGIQANTLPVSPNSISMSQVNTELGIAATTTISLNDSAVRTLFGKASGAISMGDGLGKSRSYTVDVLLLAGGGAGGSGNNNSNGHGGGGAGGLLDIRTFTVYVGSGYNITVGAGGTTTGSSGNNGANTTGFGYTAIGGGGGAGTGVTDGGGGGSGGGARRTGTTVEG